MNQQKQPPEEVTRRPVWLMSSFFLTKYTTRTFSELFSSWESEHSVSLIFVIEWVKQKEEKVRKDNLYITISQISLIINEKWTECNFQEDYTSTETPGVASTPFWEWISSFPSLFRRHLFRWQSSPFKKMMFTLKTLKKSTERKTVILMKEYVMW